MYDFIAIKHIIYIFERVYVDNKVNTNTKLQYSCVCNVHIYMI